jgi:hypothetical protein
MSNVALTVSPLTNPSALVDSILWIAIVKLVHEIPDTTRGNSCIYVFINTFKKFQNRTQTRIASDKDLCLFWFPQSAEVT